MEQIYKDPLFSAIILVAIVLLIALADYSRNRFRQKNIRENLKNFAKNFEHFGLDSDIAALLESTKYSASTLSFIAKVYVASGDYDNAIKIYLTILDKTQSLSEKMQVLELLGAAYYKCGFLQKAKDIFIEILKNNPRNTAILGLLMQSYETLGEYKNALSIIACLDELDEDTTRTKAHLQMLILINDSFLPPELREEKIVAAANDTTRRLALGYLKSQNPRRFWAEVEALGELSNYIDLVWNANLPPLEARDSADSHTDSRLDLQKNSPKDSQDSRVSQDSPPPAKTPQIPKNRQLADIYRAKGMLDDGESCETFALEALRLFKKHAKKRANLGFKYRCAMCQGSFPFEFHRCPSCGELGALRVVLEIIEVNDEKNYSLL